MSSFDNYNHHNHHHHNQRDRSVHGSGGSNYVVNIRDGQNYPKSLVRELIVYACDNSVARDINWRLSSRRYLHVTSLKALESLEHMNVYWPTGDRFSCRLVSNGHRSDRIKRRTKHQLHDDIKHGYYGEYCNGFRQEDDDKRYRERRHKHRHNDKRRGSSVCEDSAAETEPYDTDAELDVTTVDNIVLMQ
jgi:hypothetical protein